MYADKLDGRIDQATYDQHAAVWRGEQLSVRRRIHEIQSAAAAPLDRAMDLLRLTSRTCQLFARQPAAEQRRLLQIMVKGAAWQDAPIADHAVRTVNWLLINNGGRP